VMASTRVAFSMRLIPSTFDKVHPGLLSVLFPNLSEELLLLLL